LTTGSGNEPFLATAMRTPPNPSYLWAPPQSANPDRCRCLSFIDVSFGGSYFWLSLSDRSTSKALGGPHGASPTLVHDADSECMAN
jgi:hypothetical protein